MAYYLSLKDKQTGEIFDGQKLVDVDEDICNALCVDSDPVKFYEAWVDTIGFSLAVSNSWEKARERWQDDDGLAPVLDYLESRFEPACFYGR